MRHSSPGISKNVNIFKYIKLKHFNLINKNSKFYLAQFLYGRIRHFKKIILKGRGFQGGSDEKMRTVARTRNFCGWPSSPRQLVILSDPEFKNIKLIISSFVKGTAVKLKVNR